MSSSTRTRARLTVSRVRLQYTASARSRPQTSATTTPAGAGAGGAPFVAGAAASIGAGRGWSVSPAAIARRTVQTSGDAMREVEGATSNGGGAKIRPGALDRTSDGRFIRRWLSDCSNGPRAGRGLAAGPGRVTALYRR